MDLFLLIRLIGAHLIADFPLQSRSAVEQRREKGWRSSWLYIHGGLAGFLAYLFSAHWNAFWIFPAVAITHILIDRLKVGARESVFFFFVDQAAHLFIVFVCWVSLLPDPSLLVTAFSRLQDIRLWVVALSYVGAIWPAGIAVGAVTRRWQRDVDSDKGSITGVDGAGLLIGRLERFLILTFVLVNHFEAIGFLIAAKSIFRFQEIRREAEYIIIGTMMSFSIAVVIGLFTRYLLAIL
jgi:hypothetical protein